VFGFRLEADLSVGSGPAGGVVAAVGDWNSGWAVLLDGGRPVFTLSLDGAPTRLVGEQPLSPGDHTVELRFEPAPPGGEFVLQVDGAEVARDRVERDLPLRWQVGGAGVSLGRDVGFPVDESYEPPFPFTGTLRQVVIEVAALAPPDPAGEIALALQHE
jgi:arylsulfatase